MLVATSPPRSTRRYRHGVILLEAGRRRALLALLVVVACSSNLVRTADDVVPAADGARRAAPHHTVTLLPNLDLEEKELEYLEANGYVTGHVTTVDKTPSGDHFEEAAGRAIESFQRFYRLPVTGKMDADTRRTMWRPRCGYPDVAVLERPARDDHDVGTADHRRRKRYTTAGGWYKWRKTKITYSIINMPSRGKMKQYEVTDAIKRAFGVWSDVTPLTFDELESSRSSLADIRIAFLRGNHALDKDHPMFDGRDGELAHAFAPNSGWGDVDGDIHFDDDDLFSVDGHENAYNFFQIAAHEIGHSLGLDHSETPGALMWPHYHYIQEFILPTDDMLGIQSLYGPNPNPNRRSELLLQQRNQQQQNKLTYCNGSIDATMSIWGVIYVIKGDKYWEVANWKIVSDRRGKNTASNWHNLPKKISAAYPRSDGRIVFLKGSKLWIYHGRYLLAGYPRRVSDVGIPKAVDAALAYHDTGKTYFFKKNQVWRYDEALRAVDPGYPKKLRKTFRGLPRRISSAFRHNDDQLYFLGDGNKYYRMSRWSRRVDRGYPRLFGQDFMDCDPIKP